MTQSALARRLLLHLQKGFVLMSLLEIAERRRL
jgi:hypothetical protein